MDNVIPWKDKAGLSDEENEFLSKSNEFEAAFAKNKEIVNHYNPTLGDDDLTLELAVQAQEILYDCVQGNKSEFAIRYDQLKAFMEVFETGLDAKLRELGKYEEDGEED
jgi:cell division FtsZ-interacting protein ZapD